MDGWYEVGPRQQSVLSRPTGNTDVASPITQIFGGKERYELRSPGEQPRSIKVAYQRLPLDIGSPEIRNIVDALKHWSRLERIESGKATRQNFIDELPPVLVLHLKRFHFDAEGHGATKIWKHVGYPLELEIPQEVLSRPKRNAIVAKGAGFPRFRLISVVYHHGNNVNGGHYTVDVCRQDNREWIHIDDKEIRRIRSEDVAEADTEDVATKAAGSDRKDKVNSTAINRFSTIDAEDGDDGEGWKQATASKKSAPITNGAQTGPRAKQQKEGIKDNKVAYMLFYQRI